MASIQDIGVLVESFVSGKISAADFANSFRPVFQSALKSPDQGFKSFALAIHAQISHHFNGLISEQDFKTNMESFRPSSVVVTVSYPAPPSALNEAWAVKESGELEPLVPIGN